MGQSTLLPVTFEREWVSQMICSIHSSMIDFKFRNPPAKKNQSNNSEDDEVQSFNDNGFYIERKPGLKYMQQQSHAQNLKEYLFLGSLKVTEQ